MKNNIPTYALNNLSANDDDLPKAMVLYQPVNQSKEPLEIPHRTNYYGIGLCISGHAKMTANLETYDIVPGCLITMSPHIIKQWHFKSDDFQSFAILFTKDFLVKTGESLTDRLPFFESVARHVFLIEKAKTYSFKQSLEFVKGKFETDNHHQKEILSAYINGLLFEVAALYDDYTFSLTSAQTRSQQLAGDFKKLVNVHFIRERSVAFYAGELFITPGHLTQTVREVTGRTPSEWIAEAVVLEACVLLQNSSITAAQVADILHFPDQSSFGKYFKSLKGLSPTAYRKG